MDATIGDNNAMAERSFRRWPACASRAVLAGLMLASVHVSGLAQKVLPMGSSSMAPTFAQGAPLKINLLAYTFSSPARWDIVTFRSPDGRSFLTKRVVGLAGDSIVYDSGKILHINGVAVTLTPIHLKSAAEESGETVFVESMSTEQHLIQLRDGVPAIRETEVEPGTWRKHCTFSQGGFRCLVPAGHVFVLGDNRDASRDSRYFGFIPEAEVGGRVENAPEVPAKR